MASPKGVNYRVYWTSVNFYQTGIITHPKVRVFTDEQAAREFELALKEAYKFLECGIETWDGPRTITENVY